MIALFTLWNVIGFTIFMFYGCEDKHFQYDNWKQIAFVAILCGPVSLIALTLWGVLNWIFNGMVTIYNELGNK
jgi:hypothetical protein